MFLDTCKTDPTTNLPVLLLGNKSDLVSQISPEKVEEWKRRNKVVYGSNVSAKTGEGIESTMKQFIRTLVNPFASMDSGPIRIVISDKIQKEASCC